MGVSTAQRRGPAPPPQHANVAPDLPAFGRLGMNGRRAGDAGALALRERSAGYIGKFRTDRAAPAGQNYRFCFNSGEDSRRNSGGESASRQSARRDLERLAKNVSRFCWLASGAVHVEPLSTGNSHEQGIVHSQLHQNCGERISAKVESELSAGALSDGLLRLDSSAVFCARLALLMAYSTNSTRLETPNLSKMRNR